MQAGTTTVAITTGSKTIADLLGRAAEQYGDRVAARHKTDGAWHDVTFAADGRDRPGGRPRAHRPRDRAGRARLPPRQDARGVDVVRLRRRERRRRRRAHLRHELARGMRVGRGQLRGRRGHLRGRRAAREDRRRPRPSAEPAHARRDRPRGRHGGRDRARRGPRAGPHPRRGRARGPGRRGQARGHVHDHLHVGDDRPAEGLRPLPRQLPPDARHVRDARRPARPRGDLPLPPPRPRLRPARPAAVRRRRRRDRVLRRGPGPDRPRAAGDQADLPAERPADLREGLHARHGLPARARSRPR